MEISARPYQSQADLFYTAALIRRAARANPIWNAWSVTRYDIWAQRRIADETVHARLGWQAHQRYWFSDDGQLRASAAFDRSLLAFIAADPACPELLPSILDWLETHRPLLGDPEKPLNIEVLEKNTLLTGLLRERGYTPSSDYMSLRRKLLTHTPLEAVVLPPGFSIRHAAGREDLLHHISAVHQVFNMLDPIEIFSTVTLAPTYLPELNLLVMSPEDECAAFATLWYDRGQCAAEFEPVGTLPGFQKMGLGAAVLAEGCNRLRALGCPEVRVESWSESPAANRLYEKAGLLPHDRLFSYEKLL